MMLTWVTPHLRLPSVLDLDPEILKSLGLDGLLLDMDCTLKDYHAQAVPVAVADWLRSLRQAGFRLCLVSNGPSQKLRRLADPLELPFVSKAFKPLPFGCQVALRKLGLDRRRVAFVGDQIFADVLAGRLAGLFTILVTPTSPDEPWFTRCKRPVERRVLRYLTESQSR